MNKRNRVIATALSSFLVATSAVFVTTTSASAAVGVIEDDALGACINTELGRDVATEITDEDLEGLTDLTCSWASGQTRIQNLNGLEAASNLEFLTISGADLGAAGDLDGLKGLPLNTVVITNSQVSDASVVALSDAPTIESLVLDNSKLTSLDFIAGDISLQTLSASNASITDISALSDAPLLQNIVLSVNRISDVSALSASAATVINLDQNAIADITAVRNLGINLTAKGQSIPSGVVIQKLMTNTMDVSEGFVIKDGESVLPLTGTALSSYNTQTTRAFWNSASVFDATTYATFASGDGLYTGRVGFGFVNATLAQSPTPSLMTGNAVDFTFVWNNFTVASSSFTGLPTGLSYDAATGKLTGTPTEEGTFSAQYVAQNPAGNRFEATYVFTVTDTLIQEPAAMADGNVSATPIQKDAVRVNWVKQPDDITGASDQYGAVVGYFVGHRLTGQTEFVWSSLIEATATTYTVDGLTPNTSYDFSVRYSTSDRGVSKDSTPVNAVTLVDNTTPTNPGNPGNPGTPTNPGTGTPGNTGNNGGTSGAGGAGSNGGTPGTPETSTKFVNCEAAYAAGRANIPKEDPQYDVSLDSDKDGVACEDTSKLASTGSDLNGWVIGGPIALLVLGAGMLLIARSRKDAVGVESD